MSQCLRQRCPISNRRNDNDLRDLDNLDGLAHPVSGVSPQPLTHVDRPKNAMLGLPASRKARGGVSQTYGPAYPILDPRRL